MLLWIHVSNTNVTFYTNVDFYDISGDDTQESSNYCYADEELVDLVGNDSFTTSKSFKKNLRKKLKLGNVEALRIDAEIETYILHSTRRRAEYILCYQYRLFLESRSI